MIDNVMQGTFNSARSNQSAGSSCWCECDCKCYCECPDQATWMQNAEPNWLGGGAGSWWGPAIVMYIFVP